jgi:hypothetical protein
LTFSRNTVAQSARLNTSGVALGSNSLFGANVAGPAHPNTDITDHPPQNLKLALFKVIP